MLDDQNVLGQRDPDGALDIAAHQFEQASRSVEVRTPDHDDRALTAVVVSGMGGSALAALLLKSWLKNELTVPFEVVRHYDLPASVDERTLVIASSYSGNTEETLSAFDQARERGAQVAVISSGGQLLERAVSTQVAHIALQPGLQPRMATIDNLTALLAVLANFGLVDPHRLTEVQSLAGWLEEESRSWHSDESVTTNYAKQLALEAVGKTPVFYGGGVTNSLAYKWKISWNENAKNVAFWNEYPEFNHNEFIGWTSHPIEKPFAVFDLLSSFEHPQVTKRFEISDRLLSGKRPKATQIHLRGDSVIAQLLWGCILADFVSIYVAILNGVNPTPVALIEKLKLEL